MDDSLLVKADMAIEEFLNTDSGKCDPKEYGRIYQKANIGLRIRHDQLVSSRIEIDQKLRAIGLAFTDPAVREKYTKLTLPKLLPDLQGKPEKN